MLIFPLINDTSRKIIHIDMDAFFAAIEERDQPQLKGKPVVIGRDPRLSGGRGVVSTCNYEARKFGIHSAMSTKEAYERCPQAIFISGNYEKYQAVGLQVREIFRRYTDLIEPMSIDEAYLDVTNNKLGIKSAVKIAKLIQYDIWTELQLTSSAGVSYNKFLAKIASDFEKPRGLTVVLPEEAVDFLKPLKIEKFHGVGVKTVERLHEMGIYTGEDLLEVSETKLIDNFGRFGFYLYRMARGISNSPVKPNRVRKSLGKEKTYAKLLYSQEDLAKEFRLLAERVCQNLDKHQTEGKTLVVKVRFGDFTTLTKRKSLDHYIWTEDALTQIAGQLVEDMDVGKGVRLLGLTLTNLRKKEENVLEVSD